MKYQNTSENPSGLIRTVSFKVSDGTADSNPLTRAIAVTPVNDAPAVTSDGGGASADLSVQENLTAVTTVTSADPDGGVPVYGIAGGADAAWFSIDDSSGALTFVAAPDYENPGDVGANNVYDVTVQISDGKGGMDTQSIAVHVTDVPEMTAQGPAPVTISTPLLSEAELAPIVEMAMVNWEEALGFNGFDILGDVQVTIGDLSGDALGATFGNTIVIDVNAAGYGWFVDATPGDNSEFLNGSGPSGMDLLTVVMHEMGHVLGYSHDEGGSMSVMNSVLATGTRYSGAIEPNRSWISDFVLNGGKEDTDPNKDIQIVI